MPRFVPFEPARMANIYATEAALVLINCQFCKRSFEVAFSELSEEFTMIAEPFHGPPAMIRHQILSHQLHFSDPPNVVCCAGVSANSVPVRVLQYRVKPFALGEGVEIVENTKKGSFSKTISGRGVSNWRREHQFEQELKPSWFQ